MASLRRSRLTTEYIRVPVTALGNGLPVDTSTDAAWLAFPVRKSEPLDSDWQAALWESSAGQTYLAVLVGPACPFNLPIGRYDVWVKIADNPEIPVRKIGPVIIQ